MSAAGVRARTFILNCRLRQYGRWCSSNRGRLQSPRKFHTQPILRQQQQQQHQQQQHVAIEPQFRPYYVTTPIFYVNAEPHIGHLYTLILADVLKRWEVLKGDQEAALLTGTDEHGMKVQRAAADAGQTPQNLCDTNSQHFLKLAEVADISFDRFMRTTDDDHKEAVAHFWKELLQRGYIYESKHEGWYAVSDETFYPQSQIHLIQDPATGRKFNASKETNKEVEWSSEINYRFRLSAFQDRLLEHYKQHPTFIIPDSRFADVKREVAAGLEDLSISRPSSRLTWGIPVPGDASQTIYVWLDALINYLTMSGYPEGHPTRHKLWPPNVQVIGKDIVRFHTIYWPAFLMALDLPLPRTFLTHAHWTLGKAKMSKSLGNGVDPYQAIARFGLDTIRYFMMHDGSITNDADYDNSYIIERYQHGLQSQLGNLSARVQRSFQWSIKECLNAVAADETSLSKAQPSVQEMLAKIDEVSAQVDQYMTAHNPRSAIHAVMNLVAVANKFWDHSKPWVLAKSTEPTDKTQLQQIVFTAAEVLRVSFILLQPVMPGKMREALDGLQVDVKKRSFAFAHHGADFTYGNHVNEKEQELRGKLKGRDTHRRVFDRVLFPPLPSNT